MYATLYQKLRAGAGSKRNGMNFSDHEREKTEQVCKIMPFRIVLPGAFFELLVILEEVCVQQGEVKITTRYTAKKTTSNPRIAQNISVSGMKISIPGH